MATNLRISHVPGPLNRLYLRIKWSPMALFAVVILLVLVVSIPLLLICCVFDEDFVQELFSTMERVFDRWHAALDRDIVAYRDLQR